MGNENNNYICEYEYTSVYKTIYLQHSEFKLPGKTKQNKTKQNLTRQKKP